VTTSRFTTGEKSKKETTLPAGIWKMLYAQADVILHGEFGKERNKQGFKDRIFVTEGSEDCIAGNRSQAILPAKYIVDKKDSFKQFASFFTDPKAAAAATAAYQKAYVLPAD
jgi:hypothetical protein